MDTKDTGDTGESGPRYELVWRGRAHLGSEPGVYGDACYSGLCIDWPLTIRKYDLGSSAGGPLRIRLEAEDVEVFSPYPGHKVTVARYVPDPSPEDRFRWRRLIVDPTEERRLTTDRLDFDIELPGDFATVYLSLRVEVGTELHPGLYDELVVTRLSVCSTSHYATFGFEYEGNPGTDT